MIPPTQSFLALTYLVSLLASTLAAPPIVRGDTNEWTDPYHLPSLPGTTISLILSGFMTPRHVNFDGSILFQIAATAQADIVQETLTAHGDAPIPRPNLDWKGHWNGRWMVLRVNHKIDNGFRWSDLSEAIKAIVEFGWQTNFVTVRRVSILDAQRGELAQAELVPFRWNERSWMSGRFDEKTLMVVKRNGGECWLQETVRIVDTLFKDDLEGLSQPQLPHDFSIACRWMRDQIYRFE